MRDTTKNSCGFVCVVFQEPPEPFTALLYRDVRFVVASAVVNLLSAPYRRVVQKLFKKIPIYIWTALSRKERFSSHNGTKHRLCVAVPSGASSQVQRRMPRRDMDCTAGRPQMWRLGWSSGSTGPPPARGTRVTNGDGGGVQQRALWIHMGSQYQLYFPMP